MEPLKFFIADLADTLVKSHWLDPDEAQTEARCVESEHHDEIAQAMELGYGVIVFIVAFYHLEATFDKHGMTRLRRIDIVSR